MKLLPIVSIVGKSGSGKTALMEQLIAEFKRRGYKVAALKHSPGGMEIDQPGKDSWRFAQAGSDAVLVSSRDKLAFVKNLDHEFDIEEILPIMGAEFDLVLAEGFKKGKSPKIEVHRRELGDDLVCAPGELSAIVTNGSLNTDIPLLTWGDTVAVADFIEENFVKKMFTVGILTISDKGWRGERQDKSGEVIRQILSGMDARVVNYAIIPDEKELIVERLVKWADEDDLDVVLTTGGTGLSPRDITPEATLSVVDRIIPGFAEAMRAESLKKTPMAMLSRAVVGTRGKCLIINLPGSPKAVHECLEVILPALPHALETLKGQASECGIPETQI